MQLEELAAWIRAEIGAFKGHPGRSNPYPELLRCRAVEYYRARRDQGARLRDIASEIDVKWQSLSRWTSSDTPVASHRATSFERVAVIDSHAPSPPNRFVVHAPKGLWIEGLDIDALAELIRRLA